MKIRDRIRRFLGTEDLLAESAHWNKELSKQSAELAASRKDLIKKLADIYDAELRMRALIVGEFGKMKPASNEFLDALFKENRDRLDMVMVSLDSFAEKVGRRR
jgi:hypothetical protein